MNRRAVWQLAALLGLALLAVAGLTPRAIAQPGEPAPLITGSVFDRQQIPVVGAAVTATAGDDEKPLAEAATQPDGRFALAPATPATGALTLKIHRPHFEETRIVLDADQMATLRAGETVAIDDTVLLRQIDASFWIAALVFVAVLVLIATGRLHNALAALLGMVTVLGVSYLGGALNENLFIFDFRRSLTYVDWNVIFLIMGMMIVIAVVERTGIFQWMAYRAYLLSRGRTWLLLLILMVVTGVASAFLDNVTTMLLMTPISVQIALAIGITPLALLIPEVLASNVVGISTLIGTPTNILIGSYARISFNDFLRNLTPGVLMALAGLMIYCLLIYRRSLTSGGQASPLLMERLAERARITEPEHLRKAAWVGAGMLLLFIFGEHVHLVPAVTALLGATALLLWIKPDIEEMIEAVDWTTLVFFIALFVVVGAVQEVGLISFIAELIGRLVGDNLVLAMLAVIWLSAFLSTIIANIPFTAAMLPVIGYLTLTIPGANSKVLFYCLSVGSAMGGNGSLIGASANMVTSGISERAGYTISYGYFFRKGFPALLITVSLATIWLLLRFIVLPR